ncbi:hypothetical protein JTE90_026439 [Oedothorax gibbosus]|uniref:Uncharacterized protein n=1 Tax=Oedothorax gibbosus TaxID=931172 RepID=A0AAV6VSP7_9ARAC|nr:hypothetical protein JTE90_026439 [Oedothorax gibbosus]
MTAIFTSDSEDFFRRMLLMALVIPGGIQERGARARGAIAEAAEIIPGNESSENGQGMGWRLRDPARVAGDGREARQIDSQAGIDRFG